MRATTSIAVPKRLKERVGLWQRRFHLQGWSIAVKMSEFPKRKRGTEAETTWTKNYQNATISFNVDTYPGLFGDELDLLICHELQHVMEAREDDAISRVAGSDGEVYKEWERVNEPKCDAQAQVMVAAYRRPRKLPV